YGDRRRPAVRAGPRRTGASTAKADDGCARHRAGGSRSRRRGHRRGTPRDGCAPMIVLSGAALVLPDRILTPGSLTIDGERIVDVGSGSAAGSHTFAFDHYIVLGFIDV